jgi:hypothetical protein
MYDRKASWSSPAGRLDYLEKYNLGHKFGKGSVQIRIGMTIYRYL